MELDRASNAQFAILSGVFGKLAELYPATREGFQDLLNGLLKDLPTTPEYDWSKAEFIGCDWPEPTVRVVASLSTAGKLTRRKTAITHSEV